MRHLLTGIPILLALAACTTAGSERGRPLTDVRNDLNQGRWDGLELIAAPRPASAPSTATAASAAAPASPISRLPPPTGKPLREATRLEDPALGIPLPGSASAPKP